MNEIMKYQTEKQTDEQLAESCRKSDHRAFQELMNRYLKTIFNFARQYAQNIEDAEDITQDTFFKVWKYISRYEEGMIFRPWLYTIARNTALDQLKKKKAYSFSDLDNDEAVFADTLEDKEPSASEIFENAALAKVLSEKLSIFHPDHRIVIILHYEEEMTFEEIAQVMGKPANTIKSWHRRTIIRLKKLMKDSAPLMSSES